MGRGTGSPMVSILRFRPLPTPVTRFLVSGVLRGLRLPGSGGSSGCAAKVHAQGLALRRRQSWWAETWWSGVGLVQWSGVK